LLAQGSLRYRRQILALKHYFARHPSTVMMLDDLPTESTDRAVPSIAHSVVRLDQLAPIYGERPAVAAPRSSFWSAAAIST
jgi:circadian clock protein KaiC